MADNNTYPKFISNTPCGEDKFESGSQNKIALSIAEHIKGNEKDFKLIGLDGSWGSGKSNVINIAKNHLGDKYHVFIYDAWAHQEDLQRRSFLEELIEELQKANILEQKKWGSILKSLLAKRKETITSTVPELSPAIILALIVTFLTPITSCLSVAMTGLIAKILFATLPISIAIVVWCIAAIINEKYRGIHNLFYIYKERELEKTTSEIISEKEPSVREFKQWMEKLSADLKLPVIIVFDNMDRLAPAKVQALWSSIHTFFSEKSYKNIWVILPFDRVHIQEAFEKELANHFINKTFSVIYSVAPPVLTDWKGFFELTYNEAFGLNEGNEKKIVMDIFDLYQEVITPRKIIAFINELVSLKMIWKEEMQLRYIALYTLNREKIAINSIQNIISEEYLQKAKLLFRGDTTVSNNISALLYNVPIEKASQVTLYRAILNSIRNKNEDELLEFSKHSDFYTITEQVISKEEINWNDCILMLSRLNTDELDDYRRNVYNSIWHLIVSSQNEARSDNQKITDSDKILFEKANALDLKNYLKYLIKSIAKEEEFNGSQYYKSLKIIEEVIKEKTVDINIIETVQAINLKPWIFLDYLEIAQENYSQYKVSCDVNLLDEDLASEMQKSDLKSVSFLRHIKKASFPKLIHAIESRIEQDQINKENFFSIFDTYKAIYKDKPLPKKLSNTRLNEIISELPQDTPAYYEAIAMRLACFNTFEYTSEQLSNALQSNDSDFTKEISGRIEFYCSYNELLIKSIGWDQPLVKSVAINLTLHPSQGSKLSISDILKRFMDIIGALPIDGYALIKRIAPWSSQLNLSSNSLPELIPNIDFYEVAFETENQLTKLIIKSALNYINNITEEEWCNLLLIPESYQYKIMTLFLTKEKIDLLPDNFIKAFINRVKGLSNGDLLVPDGHQQEWDLFYEHIDKIHLESSIIDIRDRFINQGDITANKFWTLEKMLRDAGNLEKRSASVTRTILFRIINDEACLNLLVENAKFYAAIVGHSGNEGMSFIEGIRQKIQASPDNKALANFGAEINSMLAAKIKIISARYYSTQSPDEKFLVVTNKLKKIIEKDNNIHFRITNEFIAGEEDPDYGINKNLEIEYEFENQLHRKVFAEHNWLSLP